MAHIGTQELSHKFTSRPASGRLVAICKAVAEPLRLDILRVLSHDSFGVQELATIFSVPQPGMSHHLKIMVKTGLLVSRRQGNSIFYRRTLLRSDSEFHEFMASLFTTVGDLPLSSEVVERMQSVYEGRSYQSRLYFERNVDKFSEHQEMLCDLNQYLPHVIELLDIMELPKQSQVMEVGPGQGQLLRELAKRYDRLVALDNSEEMLGLAQQALDGVGGLQFIKTSLEHFDSGLGALDAVVLNMVLHHMSSPSQALQKIRRLLREGGYLLLADLCLHNQEWTRSSCGDVWLGFDPQDLRDWALDAGFEEDQSLYLGLKNGFQIQLKLFRARDMARTQTLKGMSHDKA